MTAREALSAAVEMFPGNNFSEDLVATAFLRAITLILHERMPMPEPQNYWVKLKDMPVHEKNEHLMQKINLVRNWWPEVDRDGPGRAQLDICMEALFREAEAKP